MNHAMRNASRLGLSRGMRLVPQKSLNVSVAMFQNPMYGTRRYNSSNIDKTGIPSVDPSVLPSIPSSLDEAAATMVAEAPPKVNFVIESLMTGIDHLHTYMDLPYWGAIVAITIGIRIVLFPVALKTIQGSARMASMRPELDKLKTVYEPHIKDDPSMQKRYQQEMMALFVKHKVNPLRAMLWPLAQFPVFIGFFMALRDMGAHYPGYSSGGMAWFTDLSAADPTMILPLFNAIGFLAMIELGADGMQMGQQQKTFMYAMRGLAVIIVPLTMSMPSGLFVYWCTNNTFSLGQTLLLKNKDVKKFFDIPEAPAPENTPPLKLRNPFAALSETFANDRARDVNAKAEILTGVSAPPPPPISKATPGSVAAPVTFAMPPRTSRKPKATGTGVSGDGKKK